ncbi:hypothetical protein GCM10020220_020260 [Nonomuraea rubra]
MARPVRESTMAGGLRERTVVGPAPSQAACEKARLQGGTVAGPRARERGGGAESGKALLGGDYDV